MIVAVVFTLGVGLLSAIGAGASYRSVTNGTNVLFEIGNLPVIADMRKLVLGEQAQANNPISTKDGRMNTLVFGVGGSGHGGPELSDTIILVSTDLNDKRVGMLSIPRDLAFPLGDGRFQKINAVNAYAEQDNPGEGAMIAAKSIGKLLDVRIDHVIKIDFRGFEKFIDTLGGLDIDVERGFVDASYPTIDDEWQTVSFKAGEQHMNGYRALIYVRSRHGNNGEAGDFARSRRQQKVIAAVVDKLLSLGTLANPAKIAELWSIVSSHIQTDLTIWDTVKLARLASSFNNQQLSMRVLTDDVNGELVPANVDGSFMLFPKKPDWSEIRVVAQNPFESKAEIAEMLKPAQEVRVEIKNGTTRNGFATQISAELDRSGYIITEVGNAVQRGYERTVIFDLTNGQRLSELARLKQLLNANVSTVEPLISPDDPNKRTVFTQGMTAENIDATSTDFLIILGESSLGLITPYAQ
ncbi:MAG: LCP family protein [Patescibacteria group bacterium]|nr:LCP family protein [Patescibacteria group bacterium]